MKIQKTLYFEIRDDFDLNESITQDVSLFVKAEDIKIILLEGDGERAVLQNINQIANFIKGIPDEIIKNLSENSYDVIVGWFRAWLERMEEIRKKRV